MTAVIGHTYKCCTLRFLIQPLEIAAFSDDCAVMWRMLCNPWEEKQYNVISHILHPLIITLFSLDLRVIVSVYDVMRWDEERLGASLKGTEQWESHSYWPLGTYDVPPMAHICCHWPTFVLHQRFCIWGDNYTEEYLVAWSTAHFSGQDE